MILKFEEYTRLNEGVESVVTFSELSKLLSQFGWTYKLGNGGRCMFYKGNHTITFHLLHGGAVENRKMDVGSLDRIRSCMIEDFENTGDPSEINAVPWNEWNLPNPFDRELEEYDSETGLKKSEIELLSKITFVKQLFKNVGVIKNDKGEYNLCKSKNDLRPLLDKWYSYYGPAAELGGKLCLGYDDECDGDLNSKFFGTNKFEIKPDGTLGQTWKVDYVVESVKKC